MQCRLLTPNDPNECSISKGSGPITTMREEGIISVDF